MVMRRNGWALVVACVVAWLAGAAGAGEIVITAKDLTGEVGRRQAFTITTPAGQPMGELATAVIGKRMVGKGVLYREAVRFGQMRLQDSWVSVAADEVVIRDSFGGPLPVDRCYFLYNHFHNALEGDPDFAAAGPTRRSSVDRYTIGLEKTFCHGCWSAEIRMPSTAGTILVRWAAQPSPN